MSKTPEWTPPAEAMRWLNEVELVQGGSNGPTIKLRAAISAMAEETFALAAGQCANVVGDDGGTPQCRQCVNTHGATQFTTSARRRKTPAACMHGWRNLGPNV